MAKTSRSWDEAVRLATGGPGAVGPVTAATLKSNVLACDAPPWDQGVTYRLLLVGDAFTIQRLSRSGWEDSPLHAPDPGTRSTANAGQGVRIFISHSSADAGLAQKLIHLIEAGVDAPGGTIRCTSVDGYKLEGGDDAPDELRRNLEHCGVVLGLLTSASIESSYVLLELGAAWAFRKRAIPLLGPGASFKDLPGPFGDLHALRLVDDVAMIGLAETLSKHTGLALTHSATKIAAAAKALSHQADMLTGSTRTKPAEPGASTPATLQAMGDDDITMNLRAWFADVSAFDVSGKPITFARIDEEAKIPRGSAKRLIASAIEAPWSEKDRSTSRVTLVCAAEGVRDVRGR
jgi:hypothetical protein